MTDMAKTEVRERRPSDISHLANALEAVHAQDGYPVEGIGNPRAWLALKNPINAWTATLNDTPVAQVTLTRPDRADDAANLLQKRENVPLSGIAVLGRLFVSPSARGYGLGQRLTQTALDAAHVQGLQVVLDVMEKDAAAISLYEKMGWRRLGKIKHYHSGDKVEPAVAYAAPEL